MRVLKIFKVNIFAAARDTEDFLTFELQRWGHTARVWCHDFGRRYCSGRRSPKLHMPGKIA